MEGRLNDILPETISDESERIILDLIRRKMAGGGAACSTAASRDGKEIRR